MRFVKMQGIGNDFILVDGFRYSPSGNPAAFAAHLCDRHFGIGADGLIWVGPSEKGDAAMRVFNSDGSEAEMCGNGLRCAVLFLKRLGLADKLEMCVETGAGLLRCWSVDDSVTVDMGTPQLEPEAIPVDASSNRVEVVEDGCQLSMFCVSMGNPHAVTFDLFPDRTRLYQLGAKLEKHPLFPRHANIEFCRMNGRDIEVRVWERGDGPTLACGTGACACLVAAASMGLSERECDVLLPGGRLHILWREDGHVFMTGGAEVVYRGEIDL